LGVRLMNASGSFLPYSTKKLRRIQVLTLFKIAILLFIVVTGTMIKFLGEICTRQYQPILRLGRPFW
jgi:multisubunit Na+/H+ antiporter MnhC subunit